MKVLFAPDWRRGVSYQQLLADALKAHEVDVAFLAGYRRVLPLCRGVRPFKSDLVHLHWPEPYWLPRGGWTDSFRAWRYLPDIALTRIQQPLVYTAHNLWPHNLPHSFRVRCICSATLRASSAVIAHSRGALDELLREFPIDEKKCAVIPHGDLSVDFPLPLPQAEARARLQLGSDSRPLALMFGHVEPYKGLDEIIHWWKQHRPEARLAIVGHPIHDQFKRELESMVGAKDPVVLRLQRVDNAELSLWLSAANCAVFNYRQIFTSGAACLARSWGLPLVLPDRLQTLDLQEPTRYVQRFHSVDEDFAATLAKAFSVPSNFATAQPWRESTAWPLIAQKTSEIYQQALSC